MPIHREEALRQTEDLLLPQTKQVQCGTLFVIELTIFVCLIMTKLCLEVSIVFIVVNPTVVPGSINIFV